MIELKDAQAQMERMMQLDFGPKGRDQRQEVLRLMCQARTVAIIQKATTEWLESRNPKFPKPGEIYAIIANLNVEDRQAEEDKRRREDWAAASREQSSPRKEIWEMTAEELDKIANFQSGLPTDVIRRAGALKAWKEGGPKALNDWRIKTSRRQQLKPVSLAEVYHGEF